MSGRGRRLGVGLALGLLLALAAMLGPPHGAAEGGTREVHIWVRDSIFNPAMVRVAVGTTVVWHFEGRNPHTVTAEDGSFDSGYLNRGDQFKVTFDQPGRYPYYCIPHGAPGSRGMAGVIVVGEAGEDGFELDQIRTEPRPGGPITIRVPEDYPTIQEAVDAAYPEDLILIAPGIYHESVVVLTPRLTIRGLDRNRVILDGQFRMDNGFTVLGADGVVIENLTARHYTLNGFYWTGVQGYRASYLTAYNNGDYGIYAFDSRYGQFDHSYASGHPDSGFYIGQCKPCDAIITDVIAEYNGLGYSGTNAGGNLTIMNSLWRNNWAGLVPNTLDTERLAPQVGTRIVNNVIVSNGNPKAAIKSITYPSYGSGVVIAGGNNNIVEGNIIADHPTYGVLVAPNIDVNFWTSGGNVVRKNLIRRSGLADLALAAPAAPGNCFAENDVTKSIPGGLQGLFSCGSAFSRAGGADPLALIPPLARFVQQQMGEVRAGADWKRVPPPPPQPNMPDPLAPPAPAWPTPESEALTSLTVAVPDPGDLNPALLTNLTTGGTMMGEWWVIGFSLYVYLLPFVLYTAWVTIALWDLVRRDNLSAGARLGWMAAVLLVPLLGPVAYYGFGRSTIPGLIRFGLVGGGAAFYLVLALVMVGLAPG